MRKVLLAIMAIGLLAACSSTEKEILNHIESSDLPVRDVKFLEISKMTDCYENVREVRVANVNGVYNVFKAIQDAWSKSGEYNAREVVISAVDSLAIEIDALYEIISDTETILNNKSFIPGAKEPNAKCFKATYRIDGVKRTDLFYCNSNGGIYDSTIDLEKEYKELVEKMKKMYAEIEYMKRN